MRITPTDMDNPQPVTLVDSPDPIPRFGLRVNGRPVLALSDLLEADYGVVFDHGNRRPTLSFNVTRDSDDNGTKFTSEEEALVWALDHVCADCPTSGNVEFTLGGSKGSFTRHILGAGIQDLGMVEQVGCTVTLAYAIVGGEYRRLRPAK